MKESNDIQVTLRAIFDHELKTWPEYFEAILVGNKKLEVRKNDRNFEENDTVLLREYDPVTNRYTGRTIGATISYILPGGGFGIDPEYCVLSLAFNGEAKNEIIAKTIVDKLKVAANTDPACSAQPDWSAVYEYWKEFLDRFYSKDQST